MYNGEKEARLALLLNQIFVVKNVFWMVQSLKEIP